MTARPWGIALAMLVLLARAAGGEHRPEYRYTVLGYVRDASGQALPGRTVELVRDKTGLGYAASTDGRGLFVIVVRLGDESAGESLTLRHGAATLTIVARFDPANHAQERGTRVDVEGERLVERAAAFHATLSRFLDSPITR
jgi:hypothetical protein